MVFSGGGSVATDSQGKDESEVAQWIQETEARTTGTQSRQEEGRAQTLTSRVLNDTRGDARGGQRFGMRSAHVDDLIKKRTWQHRQRRIVRKS